MPILGALGNRDDASAGVAAIPIATAAAARMRSSRSITSGRASSAAGISVPAIPTSSASTNTKALAASTKEAGTLPWPSTSRVSSGLPVGRSAPVPAPPGSMNSRSTGAPVPDTPGIVVSPSTAARPPSTGNRARMSLPVLVLWMTTTPSGPAASTSPSSTANGPMADDMFPQLLLQSTWGRSTATWPNV